MDRALGFMLMGLGLMLAAWAGFYNSRRDEMPRATRAANPYKDFEVWKAQNRKGAVVFVSIGALLVLYGIVELGVHLLRNR